MTSLHFADDLSDRDLQLALGQFAAKCEVLVMKFRCSKSETVVLSGRKAAKVSVSRVLVCG